MRLRSSQIIRAPIEEVFALVADSLAFVRLVNPRLQITVAPPGALQRGSMVRMEQERPRLRIVGEVTA